MSEKSLVVFLGDESMDCLVAVIAAPWAVEAPDFGLWVGRWPPGPCGGAVSGAVWR